MVVSAGPHYTSESSHPKVRHESTKRLSINVHLYIAVHLEIHSDIMILSICL